MLGAAAAPYSVLPRHRLEAGAHQGLEEMLSSFCGCGAVSVWVRQTDPRQQHRWCQGGPGQASRVWVPGMGGDSSFFLVGNWGPHLVVVRSRNILKWELELKRWCPGLKTLSWVGSHRELRAKRQVLMFPAFSQHDALLLCPPCGAGQRPP